MSTLAEIEKAIELLPEQQIGALAEWLERLRRSRATALPAEHHDLDVLIGSWQEDPEFDAAVRAFEQVDESMWK